MNRRRALPQPRSPLQRVKDAVKSLGLVGDTLNEHEVAQLTTALAENAPPPPKPRDQARHAQMIGKLVTILDRLKKPIGVGKVESIEHEPVSGRCTLLIRTRDGVVYRRRRSGVRLYTEDAA